MFLNVIIVKVRDQIKLKMNSNDKIPRTIGLAIDIICRKTFFNIAPDELSRELGSTIEFSLLVSMFSKKIIDFVLCVILIQRFRVRVPAGMLIL